ncbi:uncharacterized protein LOC143057670 isoform X2 [Mytilus galloprovincialis]|uniref:uncharacterized protein LOC143057670 isoform X2 n=1 Tax=Mytilus galloprovincialis TaxID=29158 RepID=UPI003F7C4492
MPRGRPNWVDGKDSWFQQDPPPFHKSPVRDQEPPRDRPASYGRRQTPSYEEILDSKRREEASYRRFEDPEYSRGGGLGGPNDRYKHTNRPLSRGRLGDRPRSRERSAGRPGEYGPRSSNRPNDMIYDRLYDRQSDWPLERHVDGPNYGTENNPMERPGAARPMDRHITNREIGK